MTEEHSENTTSCGCEHTHSDKLPSEPVLVGVSGLLVSLGFITMWLGAPPWVEILAFAAATLAGGALVFPSGWKALRSLKLNMNALMTVAVAGAWIIGEGAEGSVVVFLFALSEWLESVSAERARKSIRNLLSLAPETALLKSDDGTTEEVEASGVKVGETVVVRSGQRVPLDGVVVSGDSSVNQAPITGESVPVDKAVGDEVYAGTINCEGVLEIEVTKVASDSTLSRIIHLVEEAEQSRAPTQRFVDRFAAIYTPLVFVFSILTALLPPLLFGGEWFTWVYRALALLVIACPCALVLATPVSIVSGLTALVRGGVLVKGGIHLEAIGKIRALAVDKTGTITEGKPKVIAIHSLSEATDEDVLKLAAAIDTHSEHPIARTVIDEAKNRGLSYTPSTEYESLTGRGARAHLDNGRSAFVGNYKLLEEAGLSVEGHEAILSGIESRGLSLALVGYLPTDDSPGEVLGVISIGDAIRPDARDALDRLHAVGIDKIIMLSGDNQRTVDAIAKEAGIDEAVGDLLPEDKVARVRELVAKYQHVGMIGDGVNDAPALAIATVGIAMGAIGSDTAIETADMALMNDDLGKLAGAMELGRRTLAIIRFNVAFALSIKAVFLVLAFLGVANLWMAILADTGATLLVIANSLRLLRSEK
ncbi:MAG: cadmium-translocating P-type ATPase [Puniceicoccaceae bacterium]|nr:cadmium-translocating P-type ATPase [Puniceicoccaceae bacterium]